MGYRRTFRRSRGGRRTRRGGNPVVPGKSYADAVRGNAASLLDAAIPKTVTDNLPQNIVAGDCAAIIAKAKKCEATNAAQANDLMAAAAKKAAVAQNASTVAAAAKVIDKIPSSPSSPTSVIGPATPATVAQVKTALADCSTFNGQGRKCPLDRCVLESKKAAVARTGKLQKHISTNDLFCFPKSGGRRTRRGGRRTRRGGRKTRR